MTKRNNHPRGNHPTPQSTHPPHNCLCLIFSPFNSCGLPLDRSRWEAQRLLSVLRCGLWRWAPTEQLPSRDHVAHSQGNPLFAAHQTIYSHRQRAAKYAYTVSRSVQPFQCTSMLISLDFFFFQDGPLKAYGQMFFFPRDPLNCLVKFIPQIDCNLCLLCFAIWKGDHLGNGFARWDGIESSS